MVAGGRVFTQLFRNYRGHCNRHKHCFAIEFKDYDNKFYNKKCNSFLSKDWVNFAKVVHSKIHDKSPSRTVGNEQAKVTEQLPWVRVANSSTGASARDSKPSKNVANSQARRLEASLQSQNASRGPVGYEKVSQVNKVKGKKEESTFMFASWPRQQAVANHVNTIGGKKIRGLTTIGTGRTGGRDSLLVVHLQCSVSQNINNNNIATGHNYKAVQFSHLNRKQSHQKSGRQRVEAGRPFNNRAAKHCTLWALPSVEFLSTGTTIQRSQSVFILRCRGHKAVLIVTSFAPSLLLENMPERWLHNSAVSRQLQGCGIRCWACTLLYWCSSSTVQKGLNVFVLQPHLQLFRFPVRCDDRGRAHYAGAAEFPRQL